MLQDIIDKVKSSDFAKDLLPKPEVMAEWQIIDGIEEDYPFGLSRATLAIVKYANATCYRGEVIISSPCLTQNKLIIEKFGDVSVLEMKCKLTVMALHYMDSIDLLKNKK